MHCSLLGDSCPGGDWQAIRRAVGSEEISRTVQLTDSSSIQRLSICANYPCVPTIATTQQLAVSNAMVAAARLWENNIGGSNDDSASGFHPGRYSSRYGSSHLSNTTQPYVNANCRWNPISSQNINDQVAFPGLQNNPATGEIPSPWNSPDLSNSDVLAYSQNDTQRRITFCGPPTNAVPQHFYRCNCSDALSLLSKPGRVSGRRGLPLGVSVSHSGRMGYLSNDNFQAKKIHYVLYKAPW